MIKSILGVLLLVFHSISFAATHIVFINGISNDETKAVKYSKQLDSLLSAGWAGSDISSGNIIVGHYHNSNASKLTDLEELATQAHLSKQAKTCAIKRNANATLGGEEYIACLGSQYAYNIASLAPYESSKRVYSVVDGLAKLIVDRVISGNNVIVVAHSQGNYVSEAAQAYMKASGLWAKHNLGTSVKFVGVATLTASFPGEYLSIEEDEALNKHDRQKVLEGIFGLPMLPRTFNVCNYSDCEEILHLFDSEVHGFSEVYTDTIYTGDNLREPLGTYLASLVERAYTSFGSPEANCGTVSSPQVVGQQGPSYFATTGQPITFTATYIPKPGATVAFDRFKWHTEPQGADSSGPGMVEFTNTFTTAGIETVTATPVLADGTVCTGSAASSKVTVLNEAKTNPANGHTYQVITCGNWLQCKAAAESRGGKLATIRNQAEQDWIVGNMLPLATTMWGFWIGFNDRAQDGTWVWDSGEPVTFTAWSGWYNSSPNNEDAAHMASFFGGLWNDDLSGDLLFGEALVEYK